ncbi:MAG: PaaI family thioesterase [Alphaproteobacteria bacterium]|nr:MAG: PaaI family thioesterase [Alphaproteobacteria bacterium]
MIDATNLEAYPPNVQAILKKPSPASAALGLELTDVDVDGNRVKMVFHATDALCNKWGGIQGGMVAAMLDDAMAIAIGLSLEWGQISPTLEMKTSFISAARPGLIVAEGWVVRRGKSVAFAEAELTSEDGTLLAKGSSTASYVTLKKKP